MTKDLMEDKILCICGVKNSGKTTMMERLITELTRRGYHIAAIKHDGHDFEPDVCGTDSWRFNKAGAYGSAVYSKNRLMMIKKEESPDIYSIATFYKEADLILVEGLKDMELPKIEIVRRGISKNAVSNPKNRLMVITDENIASDCGLTMDFENIEKIVDEILKFYHKPLMNVVS